MIRKRVWIGAAAALAVLAGGGYYYSLRGMSSAQPQRPRDPGFAVLLAIRTLERNPDTRLTREQIARVLPFVKALKDVPVSDVEAATVIARAVSDTFTPEQRTALAEARRQFADRQRTQGAPGGTSAQGDGGGQGAPGPGGPAAFGPGGFGAPGGAALTDEQRALLRARSFDRMIRYLEQRMK
jgi:hypothetical protein